MQGGIKQVHTNLTVCVSRKYITWVKKRGRLKNINIHLTETVYEGVNCIH